jgi:nitrogen regulatory protein PII-like uncharacterized protein
MTTAAFKFLWNGIKVNNGQLQKGHYTIGNLINAPAGTITIYASTYKGFSREVWEAFDVHNDSDSMTDYFETDRIRVKPDHPLYAEVLKAAQANEAHYAKVQAKREERWAQRRQLAAA